MKFFTPRNLAVLVFALTFTVYLLTLTPGLTFTDSGELAGVASTLGIAHPTGYPLFAILGFLWTSVMPGRDVWAMNLFAALSTAASAAVFFLALRLMLSVLEAQRSGTRSAARSGKSRGKKDSPRHTQASRVPEDPATAAMAPAIIAFATALSYGFARTVWFQALSVEVYSLHLLLASLVVYYLFRASLSRGGSENTERYWLLCALFLGLSFTNHLSTLFFVPPVLFLFFRRPGEQANFGPDKKKLLPRLVLVGLAALSLWIYLPLRSAQLPEFNWGSVHRSWEKFWYHASGQQYRVMMGSDYETNVRIFFSSLPYEFAWLGLVPVIMGVIVMFRRDSSLGFFTLLLSGSCLAFALGYSIHDVENYFLAAYMAMFMLMAAGLLWFRERYLRLVPLSLLIPLISLVQNFHFNDRSDDHMVEEYTRILTEHLEPGAVIITRQWDNYASAFWYRQRVEAYRPDVALIEKELLRRTWYFDHLRQWYPELMARSRRESDAFLVELEKFESGAPHDPALIQARFLDLLNSFVDKNKHDRPVYLTAELAGGGQDAFAAGYQRVPDGFALRLEKDTSSFPVSARNIDLDRFLLHTGKGESEQFLREVVRTDLTNIANYALVRGQTDEAKPALEKLLQLDPANDAARRQLELLR